MKKSQILTVICCVLFIVLAFSNVTTFIDGSRKGLLLFSNSVLPVLFPFFFISSLLIELSFFNTFSKPFQGITKTLFNTTSASAPVFFLSLLSGYPTGSRMLSELYIRGEITRNDAIKTATFTSTCSPVFIIATLGTVLYKNTIYGIIIFIAHFTGAIINGFFYKNINFTNNNNLNNLINLNNLNKGKSGGRISQSEIKTINSPKDIPDCISDALYSAISNILAVGGLIVIFFIITNQFQELVSLSLHTNIILSSLLEMTNGAFQASAINNLLIPCAIVSFGGLCVSMQAFIFLKNFRMPLWFYLLYKTTHTIISVIVCVFIISIF